MATNDELLQRLLQLKNRAQSATPIPQQTAKLTTSFGPSQKASLSYRDSVINSLRNAPSLKQDIGNISQGQTQSSPGALGSIGRIVLNNPLTKGILSGLDTIDKPKRFVISGIREFVDAVDSDANTKASRKDFFSQIQDPLFGFGRVYKKDGWGGRLIGLIGDIALDPVNWLTLGGTIAPKAAIQASKLVAREVGEAIAREGSEELIARGAQNLGQQIALDMNKVVKTREFIGTKSITGRAGGAALANAARKFGASDEVIAEIFKRNRLGVPDDLVPLMGLNNYGVTMFGSRIKFSFTGALSKGFATKLTDGRLGIVNSKYGEKLFKALTPGGTFGDINLRDLRFAARAGKPLPAGLTPSMAAVIMSSTSSARASKRIAIREGAGLMGKVLEHPDVVAEADTLYKVMDVDPTEITPRQQRALNVIFPLKEQLYKNIESYGIEVGGGSVDDFQIAKWRRNWFPHKMTQAAQDFADNSQSQAAVNVRQYMKVDHSNIGGSFESRNLERLVKSGRKDVIWFGHALTEDDIAKGIDKLNQLANNDGFKGNFFETNIQKAFTSYLENYGEAIATITFYQGLKEAGTDIGSMAVERGMISKDAMDSLLDDITRSEALALATRKQTIAEAVKVVDLITKEARTQSSAAQKVAGITPNQMKLIREGASAVDFTKNVAEARLADETAKKVTLQNLNNARDNLSLRRGELIKAHENFRNKLETDSFFVGEIDAQHRASISLLDDIETRVTNYIQEITTVDEVLQPAREKVAAELKILTDELAVIRDRGEAKTKTLGNHSVEFINDAMNVIQSYTLGDKYSGPIKDLQELATVGRVLSGDLSQVSRGVTGPLGKKNNKFRLSGLLRQSSIIKQAGVELSETARLDNAWVELRESLGILQEKEVARGTFERLNKLTINDVRKTLVRAMSSADPSELGAVRESITWLMVRSQLDDPTFAQRMLTAPTEEFQSIRVLLDHDRVRLKFGLEAFEKKFAEAYGNVVDIDALPAKLQPTAKAINAYAERNALDTQLQAVSEQLLRIPDVDRNPIYDTVYQVLSSSDPKSVIPQKLYQVLADEIKRANPDASDTMAESFVKILEGSATGTEPVITVDELLKQTADFFPAPARKNLSNDFRLSAEERKFYFEDADGKSNGLAERGVGLRNAMLLKQNALSITRQTSNDKLLKQIARLDKQAREELSIVLNTEEMAKLVGTDLADDSKNLARSAADFYLAEETRYVLALADEALSAHGVSLTQEGHAQLMNNVYSSFIDGQEKHLVNLYSAKNIMKDLAEKTLNVVPTQSGPKSQLPGAKGLSVFNTSPSELAKLTLIENLQQYLKDPKTREILTAVFPEIVLNVGRRQLRLTSEASILASSGKYRDAIEGIADLEVKYFGVGRGADPGGAGIVSFREQLGQFAPGSKEATAQEQQIARVESARRLQESTLGSPELLKQQLLSKLQLPGKHSTKLIAVDKIKAKFAKELKQKKKLLNLFSTDYSELKEMQTLKNITASFNEDVGNVVFALKTAFDDAIQTDKELKELAIRLGGPKAGQRRVLAREVIRQGKQTARSIGDRALELSPNSASVKLSQILESKSFSRNAIKEFFGTILGGDEFATPTVRGSEASRLGGATPSMRVIRVEDSFFGKTIPTIQFIRDKVSERIYSSDPSESLGMYAKVEWAKYLKERLANLEKQIQKKPEAMKLLTKASQELERAEKATGGLSVDKRLEYIDSLSIASGDQAPFERVWNPNLNNWDIRYTRSTKYQLPAKAKQKPRDSTKYILPESTIGKTEMDVDVRRAQGPVVDRMMEAQGLPVPEQAFTGVEKQYIKQYLTALVKYNDFIKSEEYSFAAREYSEKQFKDQLAQYDLSKIEWTIGGDTTSVRSWSNADLKLVKNKVVEQQNYPTTTDDFFVEGQQKIGNLSNLFTRNKKHLIARMDDTSKSQLIFINGIGQQLPIRLARDVDGTPNGLFEIAESKLVGMDFDAAPGATQVSKTGFEFNVFDPSKTTITVIDPDMVDDVDPALKAYKRLRQTDNDGQGTVFDPNNVWVRHVPEKDPNKNVLEQDFANPPYFKRLSEYLPKSGEIPKLTNFDGEDFAITAVEQESLYTDFTTPSYRGIRGVTGKAYATEVLRKETAVNRLRKDFIKAQQELVRRPDVRKTHRNFVTIAREKLDVAVEDLNEYKKAAELWDAHFSANRKVAHLYNMFNMGKDNIAGPLVNKRSLLKAGNGSPQNALRNYLKGQAGGVKGIDVNALEESIQFRKLFGDSEWAKSQNSKIVSKAQELNDVVQTQMVGFGNTDLNVVKNVLKARQQINTAGQAEGLRADMEKQILRAQIESAPFGLMGVNVDESLKGLRTGVESMDRQVQSVLQSRQMVQEIAPGENIKKLFDAQFELDALANDPRAIQARALRSEIEWMQAIRGEIKTAAEKELAKKEVFGAGPVGKPNQNVLSIDSIAKFRAAAIKTIKETMAQDPFKGRPGEYLIMTDPDKELAELVKAQKAFDAGSVQNTASDVLEAQKDVDFFSQVIERGVGIKKSAKGVKTPEEYADLRTEYQLFVDDISPRLRAAANPLMDEKIRDQIIKEANAHVEYMRQIASITEAKRFNAVIQGMTKGSYYAGKPGEQKLTEGRVFDSEVAALDFRRQKGAPAIEWITHFDDGMVRLGKQFPNIQVSSQIAEFVQNVHRLQEPAIAMEFNRLIGKYTRFFKAYATLSPGFHFRNAISNAFMLFAAGGNPRNLMEALEMSRSLNEASRAGKSVEQWLNSLPSARRARASIAVRASAASGGGDSADRLRNLYLSGRVINNKLTSTSKSFGQWIEGHSRFMLAYDGAMQGMDFDTATARVQRFLIDYEDVSSVDKTLRQIIPFWMWTSRNLPMQIQNIWLNPRAYQAYGNFKRNFMEDREEQEVVPVWMRDMGAWKLPFGQNLYATPDFGFNRIRTDVNMLEDPARLLSNVNPLIRLPIELMGEKQLFSNKRFSETPVPVESFPGTAVQPLLELLGYGKTNAKGEKFVSDKAYYALRNLIPLLSRAESISPSMPTDPSAATSNPLLGLLGLPVREVSQKMQDNELRRRQFEIQELVKNFQAINEPQE